MLTVKMVMISYKPLNFTRPHTVSILRNTEENVIKIITVRMKPDSEISFWKTIRNFSMG